MIHNILLTGLLQRCGNGFESKVLCLFYPPPPNVMQKQYHVHIMPTTFVKKICSLKIYILFFPLYCKIAFLLLLVCNLKSNNWWERNRRTGFRTSEHLLNQQAASTTLTCTDSSVHMTIQVIMVMDM